MTQQEKEQRLESRAVCGNARDNEIWINGAKSEAAREYWQSQQKQETPELEEIKKIFDVQFLGLGEYLRKQLFNFFAQYIKWSEWINVKDRLPEDNKSILTYDGMLIERCDYSLARGFRDSQYIEISGITHWQPLPKAPKEVLCENCDSREKSEGHKWCMACRMEG